MSKICPRCQNSGICDMCNGSGRIPWVDSVHGYSNRPKTSNPTAKCAHCRGNGKCSYSYCKAPSRQGSNRTAQKSRPSSTVAAKPKAKPRSKLSFSNIILAPIFLPIFYVFALIGTALHFAFRKSIISSIITFGLLYAVYTQDLWWLLIVWPLAAAFYLFRGLPDYFAGMLPAAAFFDNDMYE